MKVYKYRTGGDFLIRDINSIYQNVFFAPNAKDLNDPCETLVLSDNLNLQLNIFNKLFKRIPEESRSSFIDATKKLIELKKEFGIYSLSKSYNHELLWAHYANNHRGFCIEYDFNTVMNSHKNNDFSSFDIKYSKKPPQIEIQDLVGKGQNELIEKLAGVKSKGWSYENEIRITTDKFGLHDYDYQAVTGICFGVRMSNDDRKHIMSRLRGRGIKYYEIVLDEKSYKFHRIEIVDKFLNSRKYINEPIGTNPAVDYLILERKYEKHLNKGTITVELDDKISLKELMHLGKELKLKLFRHTERLYAFYYLKNDTIRNYAWGISHFEGTNMDVQVLGLTKEVQAEFTNILKSDNRRKIGAWIDESNMSSLIILLEENSKVYKEVLYSDKSSNKKEQVVSEVKNGKKYMDVDDEHGEYIIITNAGKLECYSVDGLFNEINNNLQ